MCTAFGVPPHLFNKLFVQIKSIFQKIKQAANSQINHYQPLFFYDATSEPLSVALRASPTWPSARALSLAHLAVGLGVVERRLVLRHLLGDAFVLVGALPQVAMHRAAAPAAVALHDFNVICGVVERAGTSDA